MTWVVIGHCEDGTLWLEFHSWSDTPDHARKFRYHSNAVAKANEAEAEQKRMARIGERWLFGIKVVETK